MDNGEIIFISYFLQQVTQDNATKTPSQQQSNNLSVKGTFLLSLYYSVSLISTNSV